MVIGSRDKMPSGSHVGGWTHIVLRQLESMSMKTKTSPVMMQRMVVPQKFQAAMKRQKLESSGSKTHSPTIHLPNCIVGDHRHDHSFFLSGVVA